MLFLKVGDIGEGFVISLDFGILLALDNILADHNDRQQDQLEEGLGDPGDQGNQADVDHPAGKNLQAESLGQNGGEGDKGQQTKKIGTPHGTYTFGNSDGHVPVKFFYPFKLLSDKIFGMDDIDVGFGKIH